MTKTARRSTFPVLVGLSIVMSGDANAAMRSLLTDTFCSRLTFLDWRNVHRPLADRGVVRRVANIVWTVCRAAWPTRVTNEWLDGCSY